MCRVYLVFIAAHIKVGSRDNNIFYHISFTNQHDLLELLSARSESSSLQIVDFAVTRRLDGNLRNPSKFQEY